VNPREHWGVVESTQLIAHCDELTTKVEMKSAWGWRVLTEK
jgi:hypothetical protein